MRLMFSIGAVLVAGMFAGGDVAGVAAPGPRNQLSNHQPQRLAAEMNDMLVVSSFSRHPQCRRNNFLR